MPKHILYGPVVFSVVGAACGGTLAMLCYYEIEYDRVDIGFSGALIFVGTMIGLSVGSFVMWLYQHYRSLRVLIEVVGTALLTGSIGAVFGWLLGDKREANPPNEMMFGLFGGLILGACLWIINLRMVRRANDHRQVEFE